MPVTFGGGIGSGGVCGYGGVLTVDSIEIIKYMISVASKKLHKF